MITDLHYFTGQMVDHNGRAMPVPTGRVGGQRKTATGACTAAPDGTKLVEITTDTAVTVDVWGVGTTRLIPAGTTGYFPCVAGQVITLS